MKNYISISFCFLFLCSVQFLSAQNQSCHRATWVKTYGGVNTGEWILDVEQNPSGGFVVLGYYPIQGLNLGTVSLPAGDGGYYLAKVDSAGVYQSVAEILPLGSVTMERIAVHNDGSIYVTGNLNSNITLGSETFDMHGGARALLVKYDNDFNYLWHQTSLNMNNAVDVRDLEVDSQGNIYWGGIFGGDYFVIDTTAVSDNNGKAWFAKTSPNGNLLWLRQLGNSSNSTGMQTVSVDSEDNVWISGAVTLTNTTSFRFSDQNIQSSFLNNAYSFYVTKFDGEGNCMWGNISNTTTTNNNSFYAWDAKAGSDGSMLLCGKITLTHYLNGKTLEGGDGSGFLMRLLPDGSVDWMKTMGGQNSGEETSRLDYRDGKISIMGYLFSNQTYIGDFPLYTTIPGSANSFNALFNEDGSLEYARAYEPTNTNHYLYDAVIDEGGKQHLFGTFKSSLTWYPITLNHPGTNRKAYIAKFDEGPSVAFTVNAGADKNGNCAANIQLSGSTVPTNGVDFGWYPSAGFSGNGSKTPNVQLTSPGFYIFTGYYQGCVQWDTVQVTLNNFDLTIDVDDPFGYCRGASVTPVATSNQAGATFNWTPSYMITNATTASPTISSNVPVEYIVEATFDGCKAKDTILVNVHSLPSIYIPYNQFYQNYQMHTCLGYLLEADLGLPEHTYTITPADNVTWVNNHEVIFNTDISPYGGTITATSEEGCVSSINYSVTPHNFQDAPPMLGNPSDTIYLCPAGGVVHEESFSVTSDNAYNPLGFQYGWYSGWQVDSLDGEGWKDIQYWDYGHYDMFPYSVGINSIYYLQLELWNVHPQMDGFKYRGYINDICSERVYTDQMVVRVGPAIIAQSEDKVICEGANDSLFVISSLNTSSYQWEVFRNNQWEVILVGEEHYELDGNVLYINNMDATTDTLFRCRTTGCSPEIFDYTEPISIILQESGFTVGVPYSTPVCPGTDAQITFDIDPGSYEFQWYENGEVIAFNNPNYQNANTQTLTIEIVNPASLYSCRISSEQCGQDVFTEESSVQLLAFTQAEWNESIDPICIDGEELDLNGASPAGGIYSGPGVENESFNPVVSGSGEQTIEYIYTHPESNCVSVVTNSIFVAPLPIIEFALVDPIVCISDNEIVLSGGTSNSAFAGYSGEYVTYDIEINEYVFNAGEAPIGAYSIAYSSTSDYGCIAETTQMISVTTFDPIVWTEDLGIFCAGSITNEIVLPEPMGGNFVGGTISDGLLQTENLDAGTYDLSYTYINESGCESQSTASFDIIGINAIWEGFPSSFCSNEGSIPLSGASPEGGAYSGIGIVDNLFNFAELDAGTYELIYTYVDELSGCSDEESIFVSIYETPVIDWSENFGTYCYADSTAFIGTALPEGGMYSGGIISEGYLFFEDLGTGTFPLEYSYTTDEGCSATVFSQITIVDASPIEWTNDFGDFCLSDEQVLVGSATPGGGIYTGATLENGYVILEELGVGTFPLQYTYTNEDGCTSVAFSEITIVESPVIQWIPNEMFGFVVCSNYNEWINLMDYASPVGGVFTGDDLEIVDNWWYPDSSQGMDMVEILYTYTDSQSGCTNSTSQVFDLVECTFIEENGYAPTIQMINATTLLVDHAFNGRVRMYDMLGNVVFEDIQSKGKCQYTVDFAFGMYIVELVENGRILSKKVNVK